MSLKVKWIAKLYHYLRIYVVPNLNDFLQWNTNEDLFENQSLQHWTFTVWTFSKLKSEREKDSDMTYRTNMEGMRSA